MRTLVSALAVGIVLLGNGVIGAQPEKPPQRATVASEKRELKIEIGQRVDEVKKALGERGIETGAGFAIASKDVDDAHFACFFGDEQVSAAIFYSKSRRTITGMTMVFRPTGRGKSDDVWLAARSISVAADGSYTVHFAPPQKDEKKKTPPENASPPPPPCVGDMPK